MKITIKGNKKNDINKLNTELFAGLSNENMLSNENIVSLFMFHFQVNETGGLFKGKYLHAVNFFDLNGEKHSCDITIQNITNDFLPGIKNIEKNFFIECFFDISSLTNPKSLFVLQNLLSPHNINIYQQRNILFYSRLIFNVFLKNSIDFQPVSNKQQASDVQKIPDVFLSLNGLYVNNVIYIQVPANYTEDIFINFRDLFFACYTNKSFQNFYSLLALNLMDDNGNLKSKLYPLASNFMVQFDKDSSSFKTTCEFKPFFKMYTKDILLESLNNAEFIKNLMLLFDIAEYSGYKNTHINVNILQNNTVLFTIINDNNNSTICDYTATALPQYSILSLPNEFNHVFFDKDYANSFLVLQKTQETLSIKKVDTIYLTNIESATSNLLEIDSNNQNLVLQSIDNHNKQKICIYIPLNIAQDPATQFFNNVYFFGNNNQTFNSHLHYLQNTFQIQNYIINFTNNELNQHEKLVDCYKRHHVLIDTIIVAKEPSVIYDEIISKHYFNTKDSKKEFYDLLIKNGMNLLYVIGGEGRLANELNAFIEHFKQQNPGDTDNPIRDNIVKGFQELLTTEDVFVKYSLANQLMSFQDVLYFVRDVLEKHIENNFNVCFVENLVSKFSIDNTALENLTFDDFAQLMLTDDPYAQAKSFTLVGNFLLYKGHIEEQRFSASLFPSDWLKLFCSVYFTLKHQNQDLFALDSTKGVLVKVIQEDKHLFARPLSLWIRSKFSNRSLTLSLIKQEFQETFIFFPNQNQNQKKLQTIFLSNLIDVIWYMNIKKFPSFYCGEPYLYNNMTEKNCRLFFHLAVQQYFNFLSHGNFITNEALLSLTVDELLNNKFGEALYLALPDRFHSINNDVFSTMPMTFSTIKEEILPNAWYQYDETESGGSSDLTCKQFGVIIQNLSFVQILQLIVVPDFDYQIPVEADVVIRLQFFLQYMQDWQNNYFNTQLSICCYINLFPDVIEAFSIILLKKFNFQNSKTNRYSWSVEISLADNLLYCIKDMFFDVSEQETNVAVSNITKLITMITSITNFLKNDLKIDSATIVENGFIFSLKKFTENAITYICETKSMQFIVFSLLKQRPLAINIFLQYALLLDSNIKEKKGYFVNTLQNNSFSSEADKFKIYLFLSALPQTLIVKEGNKNELKKYIFSKINKCKELPDFVTLYKEILNVYSNIVSSKNIDLDVCREVLLEIDKQVTNKHFSIAFFKEVTESLKNAPYYFVNFAKEVYENKGITSKLIVQFETALENQAQNIANASSAYEAEKYIEGVFEEINCLLDKTLLIDLFGEYKPYIQCLSNFFISIKGVIINKTDLYKQKFSQKYQRYLDIFYRKTRDTLLIKHRIPLSGNMYQYILEVGVKRKFSTTITDLDLASALYEELNEITSMYNELVSYVHKFLLLDKPNKLLTHDDVILPIIDQLVNIGNIYVHEREELKQACLLFAEAYKVNTFLENEPISPLKAIMIADVEYYKNFYLKFTYRKNQEYRPFYKNVFFMNWNSLLLKLQNIKQNVSTVYDNFKNGNAFFYVYKPEAYAHTMKNILWMEPCIRHIFTADNALYDMSLKELVLPLHSTDASTDITLQLFSSGDKRNEDLLKDNECVFCRIHSLSEVTTETNKILLPEQFDQTVVLNVLFLMKEFYKIFNEQNAIYDDEAQIVFPASANNFRIIATFNNEVWHVDHTLDPQKNDVSVLTETCLLINANINKIYYSTLLSKQNLIELRRQDINSRLQRKMAEYCTLEEEQNKSFYVKLFSNKTDKLNLKNEVINLGKRLSTFNNEISEAERLNIDQFDVARSIIPISWQQVFLTFDERNLLNDPKQIKEDIDMIYAIFSQKTYSSCDFAWRVKIMNIDQYHINKDLNQKDQKDFKELFCLEERNVNFTIACRVLRDHNNNLSQEEMMFINEYYSNKVKHSFYIWHLNELIDTLYSIQDERTEWLHKHFNLEHEFEVKQEYCEEEEALVKIYNEYHKEVPVINGVIDEVQKQLIELKKCDFQSSMIMEFFQEAYYFSPKEALDNFRKKTIDFYRQRFETLRGVEGLPNDWVLVVEEFFSSDQETTFPSLLANKIKDNSRFLEISTIFPVKPQNNPQKTDDGKHVHKQQPKQMKP